VKNNYLYERVSVHICSNLRFTSTIDLLLSTAFELVVFERFW